ncbi:MAG: hypothetical protein SFT90_06565 [Rickettsiales bacterium]|nr:hypothetical protein [Rickettsiales bacterium]
MNFKKYIKSIFYIALVALVLTSTQGYFEAFKSPCKNCHHSEKTQKNKYSDNLKTTSNHHKHSKSDDCCDQNCHCCHHSHSVLSFNNLNALNFSFLDAKFVIYQSSQITKFKSSPLLEPPSIS